MDYLLEEVRRSRYGDRFQADQHRGTVRRRKAQQYLWRAPLYALIHHIVRVRLAEGRPAGMTTACLVKRYGQHRFYQGGIWRTAPVQFVKHKANIFFDVIDEKFRAVGCPDNVARLLDILPDEPVLSIKRTSSDQLGRIIEYCENYQRSIFFIPTPSTAASSRTASAP